MAEETLIDLMAEQIGKMLLIENKTPRQIAVAVLDHLETGFAKSVEQTWKEGFKSGASFVLGLDEDETEQAREGINLSTVMVTQTEDVVAMFGQITLGKQDDDAAG